MINSKKQMFIVIAVFTLILLLGTTTYAFFNYTRTGASNTIKVGRISFNTNQTRTINLTNVFPIDSSKVATDTENVGKVEITIVGDTDYTGGIEYLVSSEDAHLTVTRGQKRVIVPIGVNVDVTNLGEEKEDYFTAREDKDATMYKKIVGNTITGNQMLLVGYIKPNTTSGTIEGINGKVSITAYLNKDLISISDTYDGTESDTNGTTYNWVNNRVNLTTSEWNSLQSAGLSFKVKVEANEGIWVTGSVEEVIKKTAVMDNELSEFVIHDGGIDWSRTSGDDNGKGIYVKSETKDNEYPIMYYRGAVENNNVKFANQCWKIVRTTDTGGVKLLYNGEFSPTYVQGELLNKSSYVNVITPLSPNKYTFDSNDSTWNKIISTSNSNDPSFAFTVPDGDNYSITLTGTTGSSSGGTYYVYKNGEVIQTESGGGGTPFNYSQSLGSLTSNDIITVSLYGSGSITSPISIKFKIEQNSVPLTESSYHDAIKSFVFDESTKKWNSLPNPYTEVQLKVSVAEAGIYYINYTNPGGGFSIYKNDSYLSTSTGTNTMDKMELSPTDYITVRYYRPNLELSTPAEFAIYSSNDIGMSCRNTETGIKLIENGAPKTGFSFNVPGVYNSASYVGYMYGDTYVNHYRTVSDTYKYGASFEYTNGIYKLTEMGDGITNNRHYTCFNTTGICDGSDSGKIYYVDYVDNDTYYYIELLNGKSVEDAIHDMHTNGNESNVKQKLDIWFEQNLLPYADKLEDTVFCNNRDMNPYGGAEYTNFGWISNGGDLGTAYYFNGYGVPALANTIDFSCPKKDAFTVSSDKGNGLLKYPIGLIDIVDVMLAGGGATNYYLIGGSSFWTMSPGAFLKENAYVIQVTSKGEYVMYPTNWGGALRPYISLKSGQPIKSGTGTDMDPYVIE